MGNCVLSFLSPCVRGDSDRWKKPTQNKKEETICISMSATHTHPNTHFDFYLHFMMTYLARTLTYPIESFVLFVVAVHSMNHLEM